jgi:hypothetical protein
MSVPEPKAAFVRVPCQVVKVPITDSRLQRDRFRFGSFGHPKGEDGQGYSRGSAQGEKGCTVSEAIDSKLRGCDVVAIRVEDVAAGGYTADRATVRQRKTGRPVRFELSEQTRQAIDDYLKAANKRPGEFLFTGRRGPQTNMTTQAVDDNGAFVPGPVDTTDRALRMLQKRPVDGVSLNARLSERLVVETLTGTALSH